MTDNTNVDNVENKDNQQTAQVPGNEDNNKDDQSLIDLQIGNANEDKDKKLPQQSVDNNNSNDDKNKDKDEPIPFEKTGEVGLDLAIDFISKHGYTPDNELVIKASETGDFSLLKAEMKAKGIQGVDEYAELAEKGFKSLVDKATNELKEIQGAALSVFDGDVEYMNKVREFASKNADQSEKDQINAMLDAGPVQARAAMMLLKQAYESASGTVVKPASALQENKHTGKSSPGTGLSRQEYTEELYKLVNRIGAHNLNNSPEYRSLQARRQIGMRMEGQV